VSLDPASVDFVRHRLDRVDDELLRELLWMSLWEMVRDCELRSTEYLAIARSELPDESDYDIINTVLERAALIVNRYLPESMRDAEAHSWFEATLENLGRSQGDPHIMWARAAINAAMSGEDVARLGTLADGPAALPVFAEDQDMRWAIVTKGIAFGLPQAEEWLTRETRRDRSDRGRRALLRAEASRPTAEAKEQAWDRIHGEGYGSFHLTRAAMTGFFWPQQDELVGPYVDRFFARIREVFETRDHPFARSYLLALYPVYSADPTVLQRSQELLASLNGSLPTLSRQLAESADDLERQIRIRAFAESGD
jgi:aminopeptidase N